MKHLFLFCLIFLSVFAKAQTNEPVYKDTVDVVDFFESVLRGEERFMVVPLYEKDTVFRLKQAVLYRSPTQKEQQEFDLYAKDLIDLYYERIDSITHTKYQIQRLDEVLKDRMMLDSLPEIKLRVELDQCKMLPLEFREESGLMTETTVRSIEGISFSKLSVYKSDLGFEDCMFSQEAFFSGSFGTHKLSSTIKGCHFKGSVGWNSNEEGKKLELSDCIFEDVSFIRIGAFDEMIVKGNSFGFLDESGRRKAEKVSILGDSLIYGNEYFAKQYPIDYLGKKNRLYLKSNEMEYTILSLKGSQSNISFVNNEINAPKNALVEVGGSFKRFSFKRNSQSIPLYFNEVGFQQFELNANTELGGIILNKTRLPEFDVNVSWDDIDNYSVRTEVMPVDGFNEPLSTISGNQEELFAMPDQYNEVIDRYNMFLNVFKTQGNTESANACYAELKQVETWKWRHQYRENPNFENWFRWRLNQLISDYTDYGTNPAKAVIKSLWMILLFALFYLFFPSEWDVTNRSEFLTNAKELFNKNREKSLGWTIGFVAYTGIIHGLNAITLSMNAFTTLGFGDIPTTGMARYVTILQGLIGWFLPTIFSVSLINQVLG